MRVVYPTKSSLFYLGFLIILKNSTRNRSFRQPLPESGRLCYNRNRLSLHYFLKMKLKDIVRLLFLVSAGVFALVGCATSGRGVAPAAPVTLAGPALPAAPTSSTPNVVTLRPAVTFDGDAPTTEQLDALHHDAHEHCFIAHSVKTEVRCEPRQAAA